jgi:hypothetical protein
MKRDNFVNENNNESYNKNDKNIKVGFYTPMPSYSTPFRNTFKKALYNDNTFEKDIEILDKYGKNFYDFFMTNNNNVLPMFTYPPEPKSVKRITLDKTITVQANNTTYIQIYPFSKNVMWSQSGTEYEALINNSALDCFIKYKVVCAKIMIKQIGIMHLSDGYGTAFDAVMTSSNSSFSYLKDNLLNVQTCSGRKVMMVDGRTGIEAFFLGSPFYHYNYNNQFYLNPDCMISAEMQSGEEPAKVDIPPASTIAPIRTSNGFVLLTENMSQVPIGLEPINSFLKVAYIRGTGAIGVEHPQGDSIFVRISPPTINVSIKIYIDLVVEGQVKDEFLSNMPQYIPPVPYDFNRIVFAFSNVVPCIRVLPVISSCQQQIMKPKISYPKKPLSHTKVSNHSRFNEVYIRPRKNLQFKILSEREKDRIKRRVQNIKMSRLKKRVTEDYLKKKNDITEERYNDDMSEWNKNLRVVFRNRDRFNFNFFVPVEEQYRDFDSCEKICRKPYDKNQKDIISFCMMKNQPKKVNRFATIRKIAQVANPVDLPDYIKDACLYTGEVVTLTKATDRNNRLFRDSITPLPSVCYQYFPAITNNKEVYPALVVVKVGIFEKTKTSYSVPIAETGEETELVISYNSEELVDEESFLKCLDDIIAYTYGKMYHYAPQEGLTIKFFGKGKFADTSFMMALLAAIYGAPSGGFYSGSFTEKEGKFEPNQMDKEVITTKLSLSTPESQLSIFASDMDDGTSINTISGCVPSYNNGKLMPSKNLDLAVIYFLTPFSIRNYKKTPFSDKSGDAKRFLADQMTSDIVKYIVYSNCHSQQLFDNFAKEIPYRFFSRANPDNYTCFALRNNRIVYAKDFYKEYPHLLSHDNKFWSFKYQDELYVEKNLFLADLRKTKYKGGVKNSKVNISEAQSKDRKVRDISSKDVEYAKEVAEENISEGVRKERQGIKLEEVNNEIITRPITREDIQLLEPYADIIIDGLTALSNVISNNKPTSKSIKNVSEDNSTMVLLGQLKIPTTINSKFELTKTPEWEYFNKLIEVLDLGGVMIAANIFGWVDNKDFNYTNKNLNKLYEGLKRLKAIKLPNIEIDEEDPKSEQIKKEVNKRKETVRKTAVKKTNKGKPRYERDLKDDQYEDEELGDESNFKENKEVADFFSNY